MPMTTSPKQPSCKWQQLPTTWLLQTTLVVLPSRSRAYFDHVISLWYAVVSHYLTTLCRHIQWNPVYLFPFAFSVGNGRRWQWNETNQLFGSIKAKLMKEMRLKGGQGKGISSKGADNKWKRFPFDHEKWKLWQGYIAETSDLPYAR